MICRLIAFGFSLSVLASLVSFLSAANAEMNFDDLLTPEGPSMNYKTENNYQSTQKPRGGKNIDDLLGPKDIFPFLPDNHRDSGTGKFNAF